jgi:hypothetical protein
MNHPAFQAPLQRNGNCATSPPLEGCPAGGVVFQYATGCPFLIELTLNIITLAKAGGDKNKYTIFYIAAKTKLFLKPFRPLDTLFAIADQ